MKQPVVTLFSLSSLFITSAFADTPDAIETITVTEHPSHLGKGRSLASLLADSGVQFSSAGGVSALPVMQGMMGDRIQLLADGVPVTAACGNQMNPPLSYVSANQVTEMTVVAGVSPVSAGGDNIAGVIDLKTLSGAFSDNDDFQWQSGVLGWFHQSNDNGNRIEASATMASNRWYLKYTGTQSKAESYEDGHGDLVLDTLYKATNHALSAGYQDAQQRAQIKLTRQTIPYQGFPNQYMDMTDNRSVGVVADYQRQISDYELHSVISLHNVDHEMGFFTAEKTGMMPMITDGQDLTVKLQWQKPLDDGGNLHFGQEWHRNKLDDWWPAIADSMMMGPNDYINISNGKRERVGAYLEWQSAQQGNWQFEAGSRIERVSTSADEVQPYSDGMSGMGGMGGMIMTNPNIAAAKAFNQADRSQSDVLADITLLATRQLTSSSQLILGLARKSRAPNLYERYSWGESAMATSMIGWFGDGNGYIGNITLKPETAHTASVAYRLSEDDWQLDINGWYTDVSDYIDANVTGQFERNGHIRNILQFVNTDATLYGMDIKAGRLFMDNSYGRLIVTNTFSWQQGERDHSDENLYQILPVKNTLSMQYSQGNYQSSLQWQWTGNKYDVDSRRRENPTDAYSLVNWSNVYQWQSLTIHFDIQNLFDEYYQEPLGGVNIAQLNADPSGGYTQLAGRGRSFDVGISWQF